MLIDGDTVVVQTEHGRKIFRSSVVKRWPQETPEVRSPANLLDDGLGEDILCLMFGEDGREYVAAGSVEEFTEARALELDCLQRNEMFAVVKLSSV